MSRCWPRGASGRSTAATARIRELMDDLLSLVRSSCGRRAAPAARTPPRSRRIQASVHNTWLPTGVPRNSPRTDADQVGDRVDLDEGLQPARQRVGADEHVGAKLSGRISRNMMPCTAPGRAHLHADEHRDPAEAERERDREQRTPASARQRVGLDPEAHQRSRSRGSTTRQDQVADDVGEHRADQRRRAGDRQRPEPVEDALLDVGVEVLRRCAMPPIAMVCAEQAGQQELQVVVRRAAGDRAAEDVDEHAAGR